MSTRRARGSASMTARCLEPMFPRPTTANFTNPSFFAGMSYSFPEEVLLRTPGLICFLYISMKRALVGFPPVHFQEPPCLPCLAQPALLAGRSRPYGFRHRIDVVRLEEKHHLLREIVRDRLQSWRDDGDSQGDALQHFHGEHEFRGDIPSVRNDPQIHLLEDRDQPFQGNPPEKMHTIPHPKFLADSLELLQVVPVAHDMEFQSRNLAIQFRHGPDRLVHPDPLRHGPVIDHPESPVFVDAAPDGPVVIEHFWIRDIHRDDDFSFRYAPPDDRRLLNVVDADDVARHPAADRLLEAQPPFEESAGAAGEFGGVCLHHRVVDIQDDRLPGKKGNESGKNQEIRHVVNVNDIQGFSGQESRAFEEGKESEPEIGEDILGAAFPSVFRDIEFLDLGRRHFEGPRRLLLFQGKNRDLVSREGSDGLGFATDPLIGRNRSYRRSCRRVSSQ